MKDMFGNEVNKETSDGWEKIERSKVIKDTFLTDEQKEEIIAKALQAEEGKKYLLNLYAKGIVDIVESQKNKNRV